MKKAVIVMGTRPEIIKLSPVVDTLGAYFDTIIVHTGQHYSYNLDKIFFEEFELPQPDYNLDVGSGSHAQEVGKMLMGIEKILKTECPNVVLVQGDTNSTLAGALAASKLGMNIGHVEAGLRSYDRRMPEEINRVITDHISDFLFAPTELQKKILLKEGIPKEKIYMTGNTIVDAIFKNLKISNKKSRILETLSLKRQNYFLLTLHRPENVDVKNKLERILKGLSSVKDNYRSPIIFPIHPRTRKMREKFSLEYPKGIEVIEPVSFLDFLQLEANARLIFTDSGGIQEESCILKIPCVTLRENTERPETLNVGSNILAGTKPEKILSSTSEMLSKPLQYENPFGDGKASERIARICGENLE